MEQFVLTSTLLASRDLKAMPIVRLILLLSLVSCLSYAQASTSESLTASTVKANAESSLFIKIQLNSRLKISRLKPGDVVEGTLSRDVYSGDHEVFAAGSRARLAVDKLERRKRTPNDHWPWVVNVFTPRHENYPTFRSASVSLPDGREIPLAVSLISIADEVSVPVPVAAASKSRGKQKPLPTLTLEAKLTNSEPVAASLGIDSSAVPAGPVTLAAGTKAAIILLGGVSAGKSRSGDSFQARLVEPVMLNSRVVLPEGTLLEGKVVKSTPPRTLSRAGSLMLTFTDLTVPGRPETPAPASITAVRLDQRSHTQIDPEGKLRGDRPGKAQMLMNIGVSTGIAKVVDDGTQLLVEAIVETATDASTAGTARIAALCASGVFMLTRHGRDVALPKFTEMNVVFDRPVPLPGTQPAPNSP